MVYEKEEVASLTRTLKMIKIEKTAYGIMEENPGENGEIITDLYGNKRFAGNNPNNYVSFDGKLFRIIGVFKGQMKIMQNDFYSEEIAWDTSGSNNWARPSTLNTELNSTYWNSISTKYQNMVDQNYSWNIGGQAGRTWQKSTFTSAENSVKWIGRIGLMSIGDVANASSNSGCIDSTNLVSGNNPCISDNWMYATTHIEWTITPDPGYSYSVWYVQPRAGVNAYNAKNERGVHPVLYLKSNVKITGGIGTNVDPYILNL